jgi:hypothetical protein
MKGNPLPVYITTRRRKASSSATLLRRFGEEFRLDLLEPLSETTSLNIDSFGAQDKGAIFTDSKKAAGEG